LTQSRKAAAYTGKKERENFRYLTHNQAQRFWGAFGNISRRL
jgi:hypothetical protein